MSWASQPSGSACHKGTGCGGTQLSAVQKKELEALVSNYSDVFLETPGRTIILSHEIHSPPETIARQRPCRVPEACRQAIEKVVQWMLHLRVIEESRSLWSSPIVMVPKKDGTHQFWMRFPNSIATPCPEWMSWSNALAGSITDIGSYPSACIG